MGERIMRILKGFIAPAVCLLAVLAVIATAAPAAPITSISGNDPGHVQFPTSEAALSTRPQSASQKSLVIDNYWIHDLVNQKGLEVKATRFDNSDIPAWAFSSITIQNSKFTNI